jgi:hypothetical protein
MNLPRRNADRPCRLSRFAEHCRSSGAEDQAQRLRQALTLLRPASKPAMIEVMIAAGAFESAALALIGTDAAWMLSRSGAGRCLANVIAPGMTAEADGEGATPALALLAAWAMIEIPAADLDGADAPAAVRPEGIALH